MPRRAPDRQAGFTLLEVMVATAILGLVMTTIYGVLTQAMMSTRRAEDSAEVWAIGREIVLRLADEIEGALPPSHEVYFVGKSGGDSPPMDALEFHVNLRRRAGVDRRPGGLTYIAYSLDTTEVRGVFALRRHEESVSVPFTTDEDNFDTGDSFSEEFDEAPAGPPISVAHLHDQVAGLRFEYVDPETRDVQIEWDTTQVGADNRLVGLPAAVRVTLFLHGPDGKIKDFGAVVDLPLAKYPTPAR